MKFLHIPFFLFAFTISQITLTRTNSCFGCALLFELGVGRRCATLTTYERIGLAFPPTGTGGGNPALMSSAYASGGQSDSSKGNLVALLTWLGYLWKLKSGNPLTEAHHFTRRARRLKSALRMKDEVNNTSQSIYSPCQ